MKLSLQEIKELIPHRDPFLLVDEVESLEDDFIIAKKHFSGEELFYKGHFPGNPVTPGALILEALAQAACILNAVNAKKAKQNLTTCYLASVNKLKFHQLVKPNSTLFLEAKILNQKASFIKFEAKARLNSKVVCTAEFMAYFS